MKLLVIIAALAAPVAHANFQFSRKKLSDAAIASLRTEVEAGARFVTANDELAKLFNVEAGHAVGDRAERPLPRRASSGGSSSPQTCVSSCSCPSAQEIPSGSCASTQSRER